MLVLAIDPGPQESAWLQWNGQRVGNRGIDANETIFEQCLSQVCDVLVIEKVESFGMPVGADVFETVFWSGRFAQHWLERTEPGRKSLERIGRKDVKMHLCHSFRAKDPNVRQALIDRFGAPGTKRAPGVLYGVTSHLWAALAVAVTCRDWKNSSVAAAQ